MEVKDIAKEAVTISEDATFKEAVSGMIHGQTNTLLVINADGCLTGEVSVADLFDAIIPEQFDGDSIASHFANEEMFAEAVDAAKDKPVELFMSRDYSTVEMTDGLMAVAATAISHQRARIPVVDREGRPVGMISRQGLKHIIAQFLGLSQT